MGACDICDGDDDSLSFTCNECGGTFCSKHRLPESHDCSALKSDDLRSGWVADDDSSKADQSSSSESLSKERIRDSNTETSESSTTAGDGANYRDYPECGVCHGRARYECDNCGKSFCVEHLSPDDHGCTAASESNEAPIYRRFSSGSSPSGVRSHRSLRSRLIRNWKLALVIVLVVSIAGLSGTGQLDGILIQGGDALEGAAESFDNDLNETQIEMLIHERINDERTDSGFDALAMDSTLREIADSHSHDMAEQDYFSHESPDGETFEDRYEQAGYLCRVPLGNNEYATGGENIAYTYAFTPVRQPWGETETYESETAVADAIVRQWMNSRTHRENILQPDWRNEGIGVAVVESSEGDGLRVYVTQNFC